MIDLHALSTAELFRLNDAVGWELFLRLWWLIPLILGGIAIVWAALTALERRSARRYVEKIRKKPTSFPLDKAGIARQGISISSPEAYFEKIDGERLQRKSER